MSPLPAERTRTVSAATVRELVLPGAKLLVLVPGEAERTVELDLHPRVIGTEEECDVVIAGAGVSRRHCEVTLTSAGVRLRDLGSKNGTLIGKVPIVEAFLPTGETARLGLAQLR